MTLDPPNATLHLWPDKESTDYLFQAPSYFDYVPRLLFPIPPLTLELPYGSAQQQLPIGIGKALERSPSSLPTSLWKLSRHVHVELATPSFMLLLDPFCKHF